MRHVHMLPQQEKVAGEAEGIFTGWNIHNTAVNRKFDKLADEPNGNGYFTANVNISNIILH